MAEAAERRTAGLTEAQIRIGLAALALAGLAGGGALYLTGLPVVGTAIWFWATVPVLAALGIEIVGSLLKGNVGLDLVAALSMASALAFGEPLAANVVALMYAGGQLLESFAEGRASREMSALLARVPRYAMRYRDGGLEEVPIESIVPGDRLLVRSGETVAVDGRLLSEQAALDESALTGEALAAAHAAGEPVMSGSTNAGNAFDLEATRPAADSTYAQIVRLVEEAQSTKAPAVRIADRLAVWFLLVTLAIAGIAWGLSGDRLRALAVLVVATPCPLILALPVALISGISRAARQGILVKNGGALEALSRIRTAILDKTGTLTVGRAEVAAIRLADGWREDEVLRLAASLDLASHHVVAEALVAEARRRNLPLSPPDSVVELPGTGLSGRVEGREVVLGGSHFVSSRAAGDPYALRDETDRNAAAVAVAIDGVVAGVILLADPLRPESAGVLAGLRQAGISRIVLASGDRQDVVDGVAGQLPLDAALGDLAPDDKLALVARESASAPTLMVGDGVNDAPALAAATLGAAMGARGSAASSQTAAIVILVDKLDRLLFAVEIAGRTRRIAIESVAGGLLLSLAGMVAAAFGLLTPVAGAMLQEAIDVAVILNALRALR